MGLYSYLSEPGFSGLVDLQDYVSEVSRCYSCGWRGTETPPYRKNRSWKPLGQCGWRGTETPPYRKNRSWKPLGQCGWRGTETPPYRKNRGWKPLGQCGWRGTETPPYRKNRGWKPLGQWLLIVVLVFRDAVKYLVGKLGVFDGFVRWC